MKKYFKYSYSRPIRFAFFLVKLDDKVVDGKTVPLYQVQKLITTRTGYEENNYFDLRKVATYDLEEQEKKARDFYPGFFCFLFESGEKVSEVMVTYKMEYRTVESNSFMPVVQYHLTSGDLEFCLAISAEVVQDLRSAVVEEISKDSVFLEAARMIQSHVG